MRVVFLVLFLSFTLESKILEVKQLFNKKIVTVKSENRSIQKSFYAKTELDESKITDITLRFSGFIEKLFIDKTFQSVQKGERFFTIYSKELSDIGAELSLARQMRQKVVVRSLRKKLSLLKVGGNISKDYTVEIKAPSSGVILQKHINQGSFIKSGKLLYQIADLSTMWVKFQLYQKDLAFVKTGMNVKVLIEGVGSFDGVVEFIYPYMDKKTKMVDVRVVMKNSDLKIYPNLFAKVIVKDDAKAILTLPKSAVLTNGRKHFVFKPVGESEFEPVEVTASRLDSKTFVIEKGLAVGDKVIDKALFMLDSDALTNGLYESDDEDW